MLMCCLSCAKADKCEQADRVEDYCINHEERPMTNADRIRQMTDKELAVVCEDGCPPKKLCPGGDEREKMTIKEFCQRCWLDWLKSEAAE